MSLNVRTQVWYYYNTKQAQARRGGQRPSFLFCPEGEGLAFKENEHPRDAEGKFVKGAGNGDDPEKIAKGIFPHLTGEKKHSCKLSHPTRGGFLIPRTK